MPQCLCILPLLLLFFWSQRSGIGATLEQRRNEIDIPLAFYSRQLRKPKLSYSAYDKELLAIYLSIRHFRFFLEVRSLTVYTVYKFLTFAKAKISDQWSAHQQRHLSYISEYTTGIWHMSGQENNVADALSRFPISALHEGINFEEMATDQERDPKVQASLTAITNVQLREIPLSGTSLILICDISTDCERPLVPLNWRKRIFDSVNGLSHSSIQTTVKLITSLFAWHKMSREVKERAKSCLKASAARFNFMSGPHCCQSMCLNIGSSTSMGIFLVRFHPPEDTPIFSPSSTASPDGRKQFP